MRVTEQVSDCRSARRCKGWDDASPGAHFVTLWARQHRSDFGTVREGRMELNKLGQIADLYWKKIPLHHADVMLGAFIIMPNHAHGIFVITDFDDPNRESVARLHATSLRNELEEDSAYFSAILPKKGSLPVVFRSYKSAVTREIHRTLNLAFAWQPRFYDPVRGERDLENLRLYIALNPSHWRKSEPPLKQGADHA